MLAGFGRNLALMGWADAAALPPLVHVHGVVMVLWFAFFILQTRLVANGRVALHRRVGLLGAALAVLVLVIGLLTAIEAARLERLPGPPLAFVAVPLFDMVVFVACVALGLSYRHRPDIHRRMMTLASVGMLGAAVFRLGIPGGLMATIAVISGLLVVCVVADTLVHRRLHPAFALGALLITLSWPLRLWLSGTPAWQRFAGCLIA